MGQLKIKMVLLVFQKSLSKLKRISNELSDRVDDLLINAENALYVGEALASLNFERIKTDGNFPDIKTLLHLSPDYPLCPYQCTVQMVRPFF